MALCTPDEVSDIIEGFKPKSSQFALFLIVSTENTQVVSALADRFDQKEKPIIFGKNVLHSDMFELFSEYYALQEISQNSSALLKDKVARRELNDRIEAIYELINTKFSDVIQNTEWFTKGKSQRVISLSKLASDTADNIYFKAPIIQNELVNRNRPSGSANAALKALLYTMVENQSLKISVSKIPCRARFI